MAGCTLIVLIVWRASSWGHSHTLQNGLFGLFWSDKHSPVVLFVLKYLKASGLLEIQTPYFLELCKVVFPSQTSCCVAKIAAADTLNWRLFPLVLKILIEECHITLREEVIQSIWTHALARSHFNACVRADDVPLPSLRVWAETHSELQSGASLINANHLSPFSPVPQNTAF